jgi:acetyl-CoA acyltransferase
MPSAPRSAVTAAALKDLRADDLGAIPLRELMRAQSRRGLGAVDDVIYGCANQAGEDNRNVARMSALLAGLPPEVPGTTVNRLCGSGMDAVGIAARAIRAGETRLMIAGGVESMTRAPFVMGKADSGFLAQCAHLRHHDRLALPEQADEAAVRHRFDAGNRRERGRRLPVSREDQDRFALASQQKVARAQREGLFIDEIVPVLIPQKKGDPIASAGRASARNQPRGAGQAQGRGACGRQRHRRQRLGRERRRLRAADRQRRGGAGSTA